MSMLSVLTEWRGVKKEICEPCVSWLQVERDRKKASPQNLEGWKNQEDDRVLQDRSEI